MTFLDFFAGVGGFRCGLEQAGFKCLGFIEKDKFAVKSYRAMHDTKDEFYADDIQTVRASGLPNADIWTAGFPCQDISSAGKQLGFAGKRSSLFFEVTRLLQEIEQKPRFIVLENVRGLLSVNRGRDFARVLVELDKVGYDIEWDCLQTSDFGLPQNRERVFIVGHLRGGSSRKIFPLRKTSA